MLPRKNIIDSNNLNTRTTSDFADFLCLSAVIFFAVQNPLIMADFASEAGDRQGYSVFGADSPFHLLHDPLFL